MEIGEGERTRLRFLRGLRNSSTAYRHETWLPSRIRDHFGVSLRALTTRNTLGPSLYSSTPLRHTPLKKKLFLSSALPINLPHLSIFARKIIRQTFPFLASLSLSVSLTAVEIQNSRWSRRKRELSCSYHFLFGRRYDAL